MTDNKLMKYIGFLFVAVIIGFLFISISELIKITGINELDTILKVFLIIAISIYAIHSKELKTIFNINFSPVYLTVIIPPLIFSYLIQVCPLDFEPYQSFILSTVISTVTTAIWEELYFRYIGCSLFREDNGKYKWYNIVFLALTFSAMHLVNITSGLSISLINQLVFTVGLGFLLLGLYIHTKSIIAPIIAHFCINTVADYFNLFATEQARASAYFGEYEYILLILDVIVMIIIGIYLLKKYDHVC